jgi:hypothetical protein
MPREGDSASPPPFSPRAESVDGGRLPGKALHRVFVAAVMFVVILTRIVLVGRGGQYFFYDEGKFSTSREAASLLADGRIRDALVYAIEPHVNSYADHIGFKLLGIAPEVIENRYGRNDHIPAYFFSAFSALCVLLLAAIALRLSGSLRAFDLTLLAGACSATLLIYSRFLVPYDLSLCFALLALWVGVKRPARFMRSAVVGALAAWAFFSYYGYWQIAGTVVVLHALWLGRTPAGFLGRAAVAGLGFAAVVLGFLGLSRLGSGTLIRDMVEITKAQAVGAVDFRSGLNTWAYLFYAERLALFLWIAPFAAALWLQFRKKPGKGPKALTPLTLVAAGLVALYAIFVLDSDLRQHLVVHGRHSRQLVPFLIVGFGLGLDRLCGQWRRGALLGGAAAVVLCINAFAVFATPLAQEFPKDFRVRAEEIRKAQPPITDGSGYYRLVNVDHFIFEPEILRTAPVETLLASPHPLQYLPFLYEGESREMKNLRRSIDHRMRLVRMAVPESDRIRGDPYGLVTLKVRFPSDRGGNREPLLAIGPRGDGDLFFISYLGPSTAELGFESIGDAVLMSPAFEFSPGKPNVLRLFSGSLMPVDEHPVADENPAVDAVFRQKLYATIDGQPLFDCRMARHLAQPGEVFAGVNSVEADPASAQFSGRILSAARQGWPPMPQGIGRNVKYGPVHLSLAAPPTSNGTAEPLMTEGVPGRAVLCYMRIFPDGTMAFGLEIWGVGIFEGKPMRHQAGKPVEAEYSFGSLFPAVGDPEWGTLSVASEESLRHTIKITVDGEVALDLARETPDLTGLPLYFGKNPIGGSIVNAGFSGKVLLGFRAPFGQ